jgi:hypothetical protein
MHGGHGRSDRHSDLRGGAFSSPADAAADDHRGVQKAISSSIEGAEQTAVGGEIRDPNEPSEPGAFAVAVAGRISGKEQTAVGSEIRDSNESAEPCAFAVALAGRISGAEQTALGGEIRDSNEGAEPRAFAVALALASRIGDAEPRPFARSIRNSNEGAVAVRHPRPYGGPHTNEIPHGNAVAPVCADRKCCPDAFDREIGCLDCQRSGGAD